MASFSVSGESVLSQGLCSCNLTRSPGMQASHRRCRRFTVTFFLPWSGEWQGNFKVQGQEAALQAEEVWRGPIWPSSWGTGCWCGRTSWGIWPHRGADGHNICITSSCCSFTSGWGGGRRAQWCLFTEEVPGVGWTLSEYCSLRDCGPPPAICLQKSDAAGQVGCPPCLGF